MPKVNNSVNVEPTEADVDSVIEEMHNSAKVGKYKYDDKGFAFDAITGEPIMKKDGVTQKRKVGRNFGSKNSGTVKVKGGLQFEAVGGAYVMKTPLGNSVTLYEATAKTPLAPIIAKTMNAFAGGIMAKLQTAQDGDSFNVSSDVVNLTLELTLTSADPIIVWDDKYNEPRLSMQWIISAKGIM